LVEPGRDAIFVAMAVDAPLISAIHGAFQAGVKLREPIADELTAARRLWTRSPSAPLQV
jgi:hypothetical protein